MDDIYGTWAIVETSSQDADGKPIAPLFGPAPLGRISIGRDGRFLATVCDGRPETGDGTPRPFVAYCGPYTYDGQTLVTKAYAHNNPDRIGLDHARMVSFDGETMILTTPAAEYLGVFQTITPKWKRIATE